MNLVCPICHREIGGDMPDCYNVAFMTYCRDCRIEISVIGMGAIEKRNQELQAEIDRYVARHQNS